VLCGAATSRRSSHRSTRGRVEGEEEEEEEREPQARNTQQRCWPENPRLLFVFEGFLRMALDWYGNEGEKCAVDESHGGNPRMPFRLWI
jgi:hypothetical protein